MKQVNLPPGCRSLRFEDGTRVVARREGGMVTVSDDHARAIDAVPGNGVAGLVTGNAGTYFGRGPANGRRCVACQPTRLWYAWTERCPRCDAATVPERATSGGDFDPGETFYEDDESAENVVAAFNAGVKGVTAPPGGPRSPQLS